MNLTEFVAKYEGKPIDFDGHYGDQCVDLYRQYVKEVLGFPKSGGVVGAKDIWYTFEKDPALYNYFTKIPNTPTGLPQPGDVVIWDKSAGGGSGHIDICLGEANILSFLGFDQNWPTGAKCRKVKHSYTKPTVLGWLRPKTAPQPPKFWPQANDTLAAFTGKDNNDPDATTLATYWEKGDRRSKQIIDDYRRRYPTP